MKQLNTYIIEKLVIDKDVNNHALKKNSIITENKLIFYGSNKIQWNCMAMHLVNKTSKHLFVNCYFLDSNEKFFKTDNIEQVGEVYINDKNVYESANDKYKIIFYLNKEDSIELEEHFLDKDYSIVNKFVDLKGKDPNTIYLEHGEKGIDYLKIRLDLLKNEKN